MASDLVKSAARALEVMEAFAAERRRMTAAQLGERLDYPRSSLNVLLRSLVAQGYLSYDPSASSFFPTLRLTQLGAWIPESLVVTEGLLAELEALRDETGETVTLTLPAGLEMRIASVFIGTAPIALNLKDGTMLAMRHTAIGAAYLSTLDDGRLRRVLARLWPDEADAAALALERAEIEKARAAGLAIAYDRVVPDTGAIAMPVAAAGELEVFVVAVAGLSSRIRRHEQQIAAALAKCVQLISGGGGPPDTALRAA